MTPNAEPALASAAPKPRHALRIGLAVLAAIETLSALSDFPVVFVARDNATAQLAFAQWLIDLRLVLAPLIAGAALVCAIAGRLRHAIVVLAGLILVGWATDLPSLFIHGLELSADWPGLAVFAARFIYPVLAAAAAIIAFKTERLVLAGVLVSLPTILNWLGVLAFIIIISIYGF